MRRLAALALLLLLPACGLPLPGGVATPGAVPQERPREEQVAVLPAGPQPDATPRQIVEAFLGAQSSPENGHAVARSFLTPTLASSWKDEGRVLVYDATRPPQPVQQSDPALVRVEFDVVATVDSEGVYRRVSKSQTETFRVDCPDGRCRIASLDNGLRITPADLARSYAPRAVQFLAPSPRPGVAPDHVVPDLLWLPRDDPAERLVQRVLDGPSTVLRGSVTTAVPPGTTLRRPVRTATDGTVTVDLSEQVTGLDGPARERLAAQLVWTLRGLRTGFARLRLRAGGEPFQVGLGAGALSAGAFGSYDPERLPARAPLRFVAARRLQTLTPDDAGDDRSEAPDLPVDVVAVSPDGTLGLLTGRPDGQVEVRTGRTAARSVRRAGGAFTSPTWGSGEQGLFLLDDGRLALLPPDGGVQRVAVPDLDLPLRQVRVSRDGVRVAVLAGEAASPHLLVGRLQRDDAGWRVLGLEEVVPGLTDLVDVAWESSTSLVVLATFRPLGVLPSRVPVDGSGAIVPLGARLPQGVTPVAVAAASGRPVVLAARPDSRRDDPPTLYAESDDVFGRQSPGGEPAYPG